jgi:hypothetical protein
MLLCCSPISKVETPLYALSKDKGEPYTVYLQYAKSRDGVDGTDC